jgi:Tol biopolymer transport system component
LTGSFPDVLLADSSIFVTQQLDKLFTTAYTDSYVTQLYAGITWNSCSLSRDRSKILLTSSVHNGNELYVMDANGANLMKLAAPKGYYTSPQLSPDMDEIAFEQNSSVCTIGLDGSNFQKIRASTDISGCYHPCYVDENRLLYSEIFSNTTGANYGWISIRLFDKNGRTDSLIMDNTRLLYSAQNVFRGDTLLCVDIVESYARFLHLRTGHLTSLRPACWASFSPDGSKIVCGDAENVGTVEVASGSAQLIYIERDARNTIVDAKMSPDNKFIVFTTSYSVVERRN